jgi:ABC-type polysaccharide/polyol phosphate transport system ATPase subunit
VVFVSHSSGQIKSLCDRAVWLYRGKIAAEGHTSDVVSAYHQNLSLMKKGSA